MLIGKTSNNNHSDNSTIKSDGYTDTGSTETISPDRFIGITNERLSDSDSIATVNLGPTQPPCPTFPRAQISQPSSPLSLSSLSSLTLPENLPKTPRLSSSSSSSDKTTEYISPTFRPHTIDREKEEAPINIDTWNAIPSCSYARTKSKETKSTRYMERPLRPLWPKEGMGCGREKEKPGKTDNSKGKETHPAPAAAPAKGATPTPPAAAPSTLPEITPSTPSTVTVRTRKTTGTKTEIKNTLNNTTTSPAPLTTRLEEGFSPPPPSPLVVPREANNNNNITSPLDEAVKKTNAIILGLAGTRTGTVRTVRTDPLFATGLRRHTPHKLNKNNTERVAAIIKNRWEELLNVEKQAIQLRKLLINLGGKDTLLCPPPTHAQGGNTPYTESRSKANSKPTTIPSPNLSLNPTRDTDKKTKLKQPTHTNEQRRRSNNDDELNYIMETLKKHQKIQREQDQYLSQLQKQIEALYSTRTPGQRRDPQNTHKGNTLESSKLPEQHINNNNDSNNHRMNKREKPKSKTDNTQTTI
ncbi:unnamed protein product [Diatraea saccharalis]|uniref:Uncharacterized protein n=1 Tax=Diatraea saccharalis TaxID=40085 RepID=A0A9N9WE39_9NEOP|nr:unnamed protein product [Diatraea saccharalis]